MLIRKLGIILCVTTVVFLSSFVTQSGEETNNIISIKGKFYIIHVFGGAKLALWYNYSLPFPCPSFKSWGWWNMRVEFCKGL